MRIHRAAALVFAACLSVAAWSALEAQDWEGPAAVGVRVTDEDGQPIADAQVTARLSDAGDMGPPPEATDPSGRAVLSGLREGEWFIEVSHRGYMLYAAYINLRAGKKPVVGFSSQVNTATSWEPMTVKFQKATADFGRAAIPRRAKPKPPEVVRETPPQRRPEPPKVVRPEPEPPNVFRPQPEPTPAAAMEPQPAPEEPPAAPDVPATAMVVEAAVVPDSEPQPAEPESVETEAPTVTEDEYPAPPEAAVAPGPSEAVVESPAEPPSEEPVDMPTVEPEVVEPVTPEPPITEAVIEEPSVEVSTAEAPAITELAAKEPEVEAPASEGPTAEAPAAAESASQDTTPSSIEPMETAAAPSVVPQPGVAEERATAPPVATSAPADPAAAAGSRLPRFLRSAAAGTCSECQPGEWAVSAEQEAKSAGDIASERECSAQYLDSVTEAAQRLADSPGAGLNDYTGPILTAMFRVDEGDNKERLQELLGAATDPESNCQMAGIVLPTDASFSGYVLEAWDSLGGRACRAKFDCAVGQARWLEEPRVVAGSERTVVYSVFKNRSTRRPRRLRMTIYFKPDREDWVPRTR